ncbi:MAG TPA: PIG-L family deacetylase [Planctomycetota bacterium]|nr:PIG-L family deacetylase [Planctomycetota bacterium]
MKLGPAFPAICDRAALPREILVLVAHPDDEVIGIGGLLAFHGRRGDVVEVVHATEGDAGDPRGLSRLEGDAMSVDSPGGASAGIAQIRAREVEAALAVLGLKKPSGLGFPDGDLASHYAQLVDRLGNLFAERRPKLLYTFFPGEYHSDHRTLARAACDARDFLPRDCRILLFGVNQVVPFGSLFDYSDLVDAKDRALACFASQLAYVDFKTKALCRDVAATVNVEDRAVTHAELLAETSVAAWAAYVAAIDALAEVHHA